MNQTTDLNRFRAQEWLKRSDLCMRAYLKASSRNRRAYLLAESSRWLIACANALLLIFLAFPVASEPLRDDGAYQDTPAARHWLREPTDPEMLHPWYSDPDYPGLWLAMRDPRAYADIDGDGADDRVMIRPGDLNRWDSLEIRLTGPDSGRILIEGLSYYRSLSLCDVTADGVLDIVLTHPHFASSASSGRVDIIPLRAGWFAGVDLDHSRVQRLRLIGATGGFLGAGVDCSNDVNGDGVADLVIGEPFLRAHGYSDPETFAGAAYVVYGGSHLDPAGRLSLRFPYQFMGHMEEIVSRERVMSWIYPPDGATHFHFGASVSTAHLDGDGRAEIIIGSPGGAGRAFIVWGDNFPQGLVIGRERQFSIQSFVQLGTVTTIDARDDSLRFGSRVMAGLSLDTVGEGNDVVIEETWYAGEDARATPSRSYVLSNVDTMGEGSRSLDSLASTGQATELVSERQQVGSPAGTYSPAYLATAGDLDADGLADLVFCLPFAGQGEGLASVIFGGDDLVSVRSGALDSGRFRQSDVFGTERGHVSGSGEPTNQPGSLCASARITDHYGHGASLALFEPFASHPDAHSTMGENGTLDAGAIVAVDPFAFQGIYRDGFESGNIGRWSQASP